MSRSTNRRVAIACAGGALIGAAGLRDAGAQVVGETIGATIWETNHDYDADVLRDWKKDGCGGPFHSGDPTAFHDIATSPVRSSPKAVGLVRPDGSKLSGARLFRWCETINTTIGSSLHFTAWYHFPAGYDVGNGWFHIMEWKSNGSENAKQMLGVANRSGGGMYLHLGQGSDSGGGFWGQDILDIPIATWFKLEARVKKAADATGRIRVWQDSTLILDVSNLKTANSKDWSWAVINYGDAMPTTGGVGIVIDDARIQTVV